MMRNLNKWPVFTGIFWLLILASFFIKGFYLQYTIDLSLPPIMGNLRINLLLMASAFVLTSGLYVLGYKWNRGLALGVNVFLSFLFLADALYGRYYGIPLTLPILYQVGFMDDVQGSTLSLLKWKDLVFVLDLPLLIGLFWFAKKEKHLIRWSPKKWVACGLVLALGLSGFTVVAHDVDRARFAWERKNIAKDLGVFYFHGYDVVDAVKSAVNKYMPMPKEDWEALVDFADNQVPLKALNHTYQGKNLVVVQVEAMQEFVVDLQVEGQEVTPFLNQLKKDNLYFENIFHQVAGGNTSDAEFILNNGLYPAPVGAANFLYPTNQYASLNKKLADLNYDTKAYHGYDASFWNRLVVYENLGYDAFWGKEQFELDEKVGWAISDVSFFRQALADAQSEQPFFKFLITLSSHHPYDAFRNHDFNVGDYEGTQVGDYLKSMAYADYAISSLYQELEASGLFENTVVVIYGDHSGLFADQRGLLEKLLDLPGNDLAWELIQKVPLFISTPDHHYQGTYSQVAGQVDIMPTILHLFGIDMPFTLGHSLLDPGRDGVVKRDGTVITSEYYFDSTGRVFDRVSYQALEPSDDLRAIKSKVSHPLMISDILLKYDAIQKLNTYLIKD